MSDKAQLAAPGAYLEQQRRLCPRTAACRRLALTEFADVPGLAALFAGRAACGERDPVKQARCARMLGLDDAAEEG